MANHGGGYGQTTSGRGGRGRGGGGRSGRGGRGGRGRGRHGGRGRGGGGGGGGDEGGATTTTMTMDALESAINAPLATERPKRRGRGGWGGGWGGRSGEAVAVGSPPDGGTAARPMGEWTVDRDGDGDVDGGVKGPKTMPRERGYEDPSANEAKIFPKKNKAKKKWQSKQTPVDDPLMGDDEVGLGVRERTKDNDNGGGGKSGSGQMMPQDGGYDNLSANEMKVPPKKKKTEKKKLRPKLTPNDISMSSNDDEVGLGFHDIALMPPLATGDEAHDGNDIDGGGKGGTDQPMPREGGKNNPSANEVKISPKEKKDKRKKSRPKLTPVDAPLIDDDDIGLGFHEIAPAPLFATGGKTSSTGGEGGSWTVPPGPPPPPDEPDFALPPAFDGAFVDRGFAPDLATHDDDHRVAVGDDDSTIPTTANDGMNEASSEEDECRNEFLSKIKFENDMISPTFERKDLILGEQCAMSGGALSSIGKEVGSGQGPIEPDADCRCFWLCPEPLMKMLRGQNKQNPWIVNPNPP
ncbi:hypothetical protein ACHAXA_001964 [Cyclostephanos tholiformis]|uniref:Uncharacterized protein n=1 Tax=Cyclostephanos tholiformis TaxID=382380 RepID=A0ABD3RRH7_9STRA